MFSTVKNAALLFVTVLPVQQAIVNCWLLSLIQNRNNLRMQLDANRKYDEKYLATLTSDTEKASMRVKFNQNEGIYYKGKDITYDEADMELAKNQERICQLKRQSIYYRFFRVEE